MHTIGILFEMLIVLGPTLLKLAFWAFFTGVCCYVFVKSLQGLFADLDLEREKKRAALRGSADLTAPSAVNPDE